MENNKTVRSSSDLSVRERMRLRPQMYIGNTGSDGLHTLALAVIDHRMGEARSGRIKMIAVDLLADGGCRVHDDGPGLPVHSVAPGVRFVERAMTSWSPGNITRETSLSHGYVIGLLTPNALSRRLIVEVRRDGRLRRQEFEQGLPVTPLETIDRVANTGTSITFWPDLEIFRQGRQFSSTDLRNRLRDLAWLNSGLRLSIRDERVTPPMEETFCSREGLADMLRHFSNGVQPVHPTIVHGRANAPEGEIEVAFAWFRCEEERLRTFVNNYLPIYGGTHLTGLRDGLTRSIRTVLRNGRIATTREIVPSGETIRCGMSYVVAVRLEEPQFGGATRGRLNNQEVEGRVAALTRQTLETFFRDHPDEAEAILAHIRHAVT